MQRFLDPATAAAETADVTTWWTRLGLAGLVDVHVHFMPDNVLAKVWAYFDAVRDGDLAGWPIRYRFDEGSRLALLRGFGVRAFSSLVYPHRPGMAEWLNGWSAQFAAATPDCVHTATFFPEPDAAAYVDRALADGARMFKAHVQVGGYDPRDPLLDPVWGRLADAGAPIVLHTGSGPLPGGHTGPGPIGEVLRRHPRLVAVIAHMGTPEYGDFVALAESYERVHLDTTMAFTDFTERFAPYPPDLLPRLAALQDKVVFGSDFPNIPYPYVEQLRALERLGLGEDWLRAVCHDNAARLLGVA